MYKSPIRDLLSFRSIQSDAETIESLKTVHVCLTLSRAALLGRINGCLAVTQFVIDDLAALRLAVENGASVSADQLKAIEDLLSYVDDGLDEAVVAANEFGRRAARHPAS